jgi:hypothetical protein
MWGVLVTGFAVIVLEELVRGQSLYPLAALLDALELESLVKSVSQASVLVVWLELSLH